MYENSLKDSIVTMGGQQQAIKSNMEMRLLVEDAMNGVEGYNPIKGGLTFPRATFNILPIIIGNCSNSIVFYLNEIVDECCIVCNPTIELNEMEKFIRSVENDLSDCYWRNPKNTTYINIQDKTLSTFQVMHIIYTNYIIDRKKDMPGKPNFRNKNYTHLLWIDGNKYTDVMLLETIADELYSYRESNKLVFKFDTKDSMFPVITYNAGFNYLTEEMLASNEQSEYSLILK